MSPADFEAALVWSLAAAIALAVVVPYVLGFRRRRREDRARLAEARELGIDRPMAQFPFIDPAHCIGCGACVRACPEGDVLGVVGGVAVVINGLRCVGHGRCADACPVGAIEIGLGSVKGRPDVPVLTEEQETTRPGVFVAGELSGLALIRNAIDQGERVTRAIAGRLRSAGPRAAEAGLRDLLVVGAGPAGIAAALAARELGLDAAVVDQAAGLGGTILHFPRRKMVLTRPVTLPGGAELSREEYTKEELLELLRGQIVGRRLDVRFDERLEAIEGAEGDFTVTTSAGRHRARYVLLALGRRGTPRKLAVPGEEREKVMYQLRDAESYRGRDILVVGGGDSAIEAAIGLARQAGNRVTLSYRRKSFHRIKQKNQIAIDSMLRRGRLAALLDSEVVAIEEASVTIRVGSEQRILDNDHVFVLIGGDPPYRFLEALGVRFGGPAGPATVLRAGAALALAVALLTAPAAAQQSPHGPMSIDCADCHTTGDWKVVREGVKFDHDAVTGFALLGAHARLACTQCHAERVFSRVPAACADCHRDPHLGELGLDCASCHDARGWDARSDFRAAHARTLFPLLAGHARVDCEACHPGSPPRQFSAVPTDCVACHAPDYLAARSPAHAGPPGDCRRCHAGSPESWTRSTFRHPDRFQLSGAHATLACDDCHRGAVDVVSPDCFACHEADYRTARDPNHVAAGIPTQCVACHSTTSWTTGVFDHFTTGFALDGAHRSEPCASCHAAGYAGTPSDCWSCHRADYEGTTDPNHQSSGFSTSCQNCHNTTAWPGAAFDHARTGFPLAGAHRSAECNACHAAGYAGTARQCYACHRADYEGARDPNHVAGGFPTTCESCHSPVGWDGAEIDHARTGFPLTGQHRSVPCSSCHVSTYDGTPTDCWSCHRADYEATSDPDHAEAGFPTTCQSCHTTSGWSGADFDHSKTSFPLTGAHRATACASCHAYGYDGTPTDCYSCHRSDYEGATDPNHSAAGFPTTCQSCHSTTGWDGASFDHDARWFPIYSGEHRGRWSSCSDCHTAPSDYRVFSCFACHGKAETDSHHGGVSGYRYESSACLSCHPDGFAGGD